MSSSSNNNKRRIRKCRRGSGDAKEVGIRMLGYISKAKKDKGEYILLILITVIIKLYSQNSNYNKDYSYYKNGQL
jgi:hypothetical protein